MIGITQKSASGTWTVQKVRKDPNMVIIFFTVLVVVGIRNYNLAQDIFSCFTEFFFFLTTLFLPLLQIKRLETVCSYYILK